MNTYVTGFTYDDINTFTITDNLGTAFTANINVLSATTISGGTLYGDGSNLTGIPHTTDTFVSGGTYSDSTDIITFTNTTGGTFNVTGVTDKFVTGGTYNPSTVNLDFSGNSGFSSFTVDVSDLKDDTNTFVTGFTYDDINTFTISDNAGSTFPATINQLSGLTVNGILSATTLDGNTILSGGTNLLTIIDGRDNYVTGTTFGSNQSVTTTRDGVDVLILTGGSNVTLSNPTGNQIKFDVTIPSGSNTFVTGFTYNDTNTFTISDNAGSAFTATINTVTGLTVNGGLSATTLTACTGIYTSNLYGCSPITVNDNIQSITSSATGATSFAFGKNTKAFGTYSHAIGYQTTASGLHSHAEGKDTVASGDYSHAEGQQTIASGADSHAEGNSSNSIGEASHAEGAATTASGSYSHAEGSSTIASGNYASHAEGYYTTASGDYGSHAEGQYTTASGAYGSHSGGKGFDGSNKIIANGDTSFVHFKQTSASGTIGSYGDYSAILGGNDHNIGTGSISSGIFAGSGNAISNNVLRSVVIGGSGITGTTNDIVYVPSLNINTTPINDNSLTQVLVRNNTSGVVEYRDASSLSGGSGTNTFVTGFTYDNSNTFTISDNVGDTFTASINVLSATTISATTYYGDGSNLTGVGGGSSIRNVSSTDTFATANETINCTSGTFIVNLPTAVGIQGTTYTLVNSGTGTITLKGSLGQTINGSATIDLKRQYISRTVQSDNSSWIVI
jgi:hypothetical protein